MEHRIPQTPKNSYPISILQYGAANNRQSLDSLRIYAWVFYGHVDGIHRGFLISQFELSVFLVRIHFGSGKYEFDLRI